jgi:HSP20 family protein
MFMENGVHADSASVFLHPAGMFSAESEEVMKDKSSLESSIEICTDVTFVSVGELFEHTQGVFNLIALRAFEIFRARGCMHGNDQRDWFLAESELLTPVKFHLSESREQLTARAGLPGFHRKEIKVSLEPRRLSFSGKTEPLENHRAEKHPHSHRHAQLMFHVINLPCEVDPSKAKATFNDGRLDVVIPKVAIAKSARA